MGTVSGGLAGGIEADSDIISDKHDVVVGQCCYLIHLLVMFLRR